MNARDSKSWAEDGDRRCRLSSTGLLKISHHRAFACAAVLLLLSASAVGSRATDEGKTGASEEGKTDLPKDTGSIGIFPISKAVCSSMQTHHVISAGVPVTCARLNLVRFSYVDFEGRRHDDGEIVVMDAVATHVFRIFASLFQRGFPIGKARLMDQYGGNDDASMADDNTSGFNGRKITGGSSFSLHAYGLAIDINPLQNPYVKRTGGKLSFSPPAGVKYAKRFGDRPNRNSAGMAETVIDVFANEGFLIWGGHWHDPIDYQHFQVRGRILAEQLRKLAPARAAALFDQQVERHRACLGHDPSHRARMKCAFAADSRPGG